MIWNVPRRRCCNGCVAVSMTARSPERHAAGRAGWLRAAVLGANDGLVSTASLMLGVASSGATTSAIATAGIAGVAAGSMAMAVGELVSVSSQRDVEVADRRREEAEHAADPAHERRELIEIYRGRGLDSALAEQVVDALHAADPVGTHLRDELGHTPHGRARPVQAAAASASSFLVGGLIPFLALWGPSGGRLAALIVVVTVLGLAAAGALAARVAGQPLLRPTVRVVLGGCTAMAITALVGGLAHASGVA